MSIRPYFRTRFGNQHVSGFETLLILGRHHYYRMFPWISDKFSVKNFVLVRSEILGLFVKYKYSRRNMQNFLQNFQTQLSQKRKLFLDFLLRFWNVDQVHNILKKKMSFLSEVFPKLSIPQEVVTLMYKMPYFRTRFCRQRVSGFETLLSSARHHYYRMFPWIWDILSWKNSVVVRSKIFGLFVKILFAEYKYSRRNMLNYRQQHQTQLSQKRKAFSRFFIAFLKCRSSLERFEKKKMSLLA